MTYRVQIDIRDGSLTVFKNGEVVTRLTPTLEEPVASYDIGGEVNQKAASRKAAPRRKAK